jgi:ribosome maturation factor RimP
VVRADSTEGVKSRATKGGEVMAGDLSSTLAPLLAAAGLELFDVEVGKGTVIVTVDRPGGVDLDTLAQANRLVSDALDATPPLQGGYTLEVSSPGLERRLRTPEQFAGAVGETLSVRTRTGETRRVRGRLESADGTGIVLAGPEVPDGRLRIDYAAVERARTVFAWGSEGAPSPSHGNRPRRNARSHNSDAPTERVTLS